METITNEIKEELCQREEKFNSATPAEQRMMVAQEVIDRLDSGFLNAQSGQWVNLYGHFDVDQDSDLREVVLNKTVRCYCCALGGIMMSLIFIKNKITIRDYRQGGLIFQCLLGDKEDITGITQLFSVEQLELIEMAYELGRGYYRIQDSDRLEPEIFRDSPQHLRAVLWGMQYEDKTKRLYEIMYNILNNQGEFKPTLY